MKLTVIKETDEYAVCVKPQGVESEHELPALLQEQLACPILYPVHRLDKETGGVMVYAKTKSAAAALSKQVQNGKMQKVYLAVVQGYLQPDEDKWDDLLFHDRAKNKSYIVKRERKGVKPASLSYKVLQQGDWQDQPISLVQIALHTGRTHQIRVQFSGRKHPLVGDRRYGGAPCDRLALWSAQLTFFDRESQRHFTADPPQTEVWAKFRNHNF